MLPINGAAQEAADGCRILAHTPLKPNDALGDVVEGGPVAGRDLPRQDEIAVRLKKLKGSRLCLACPN